jgi:hypothetical protein
MVFMCASPPNDPSSATRPIRLRPALRRDRQGRHDGNPDKRHRDLADSTGDAPAGFAAAHG